MSNKTIFILLDGCGFDVATENLGYLEHLVSNGKGGKFRVMGELPSLSRPMYETLMTGMPVYKHGITNNLVVRKSNQLSIFDLCIEHKLSTAAAAYFWMSELYVKAPFQPMTDRIQLNTEEKIEHGIYYYEDHYPDSHVYSDAEFLRSAYNPDFMLVHPMNIDDAGHKYGSDSSEYHKAVAYENIMLSSILPVWMEAGYQIVVSADHGMNEHHLHGGNTETQRMVPLYIISDKVIRGIHTDISISELFMAPILCKLLGMSPGKEMRNISEMEAYIFER